MAATCKDRGLTNNLALQLLELSFREVPVFRVRRVVVNAERSEHKRVSGTEGL
jgi:hypothetical protein